MGVENNECVIATTSNSDAMNKIKEWVRNLDNDFSSLFSFTPALINSKETVFMAPDGSKKGWRTAEKGKELRNELTTLLESFNYDDGSNPFDWIEVGYGEYGQKVLHGNCINRYNNKDYTT